MATKTTSTSEVVTRKNQYGYVGSVKRPSTLISVDGVTVARVAESNRVPKQYFADYSFNGGKTYSFSTRAEPDREAVLQKTERESVKIRRDVLKEKSKKVLDTPAEKR